MRLLLLKKTAAFLAFLWAASSIIFFSVHAIPGDPTVSLLGNMPSAEDVRRLTRSLHLDRPLAEQYALFLKKTLTLDLGESIVDRRAVFGTIWRYFPNTALLAFIAMILSLLISLPFAAMTAFDRKGCWRVLGAGFSALGIAVPGFLLGLLLIIVFSLRLHLLPVSGSGGPEFIVLPALTLAISLSASLTRIIHASLSQEWLQPYVLLARAKGLPDRRIFFRHILKNALIPVFILAGLQLGALLSGAIVVENVFSWPGIGTLLITAVRRRDFPMIQGVSLFMVFLYLSLNLLVDLVLPLVDPRIRCERAPQR
jgi:peptide/nickel transport system permease protein